MLLRLVCLKMPTYTVSLSGNSSTLKTSLFPALRLPKHKVYEIALLDLTTYNSIPNIIQNVNNKLYYYKTDQDKTKGVISTVIISSGAYEIDDLNEYMQEHLGKENISIKANNNLLRTELKSKYYIDFTKPNNIGSLLGFPTNSGILSPNVTHIGSETVNIIKVNTINLTCNIVDGSYKDGEKLHLLHTFYPSVPPGFKIIERPHNLVYLPLNTSYISEIVVNVQDQDGDIVDFRGETITLRLHIKPSI